MGSGCMGFRVLGFRVLGFKVLGQGDLLNGLIMGITRVTICVIGLLTYLLSLQDPPSTV